MTHSEPIPGIRARGCEEPGGTPEHARRGAIAALAAWLAVSAIQLYRWTVSPLLFFVLGADNGCRFTPTCSQYAVEVVREHGAVAGSLLALKRICRCHPFAECGHDPAPRRGARGDSR